MRRDLGTSVLNAPVSHMGIITGGFCASIMILPLQQCVSERDPGERDITYMPHLNLRRRPAFGLLGLLESWLTLPSPNRWICQTSTSIQHCNNALDDGTNPIALIELLNGVVNGGLEDSLSTECLYYLTITEKSGEDTIWEAKQAASQ